MVFCTHMERTRRQPDPEQRKDDERTMTPEEAASFQAAYERARKDVSPIRGRVTPDVRAAQQARRTFLDSVAAEINV